ncbi:DUF2179 domain-containing protein [Bradymonas sediminis]|uniref:UPF0316 protein DN745_03730 n=1 Tax=Bradymonas sediminis TaxID=1548548 RepID=A0A2Z4FHM7_9DELT|nr:DUF5698 domain-containing protein [Bradymonas sediminis]AWV88501.1 hypothetical protein DN745_03730 [Bradymonas sediminis]TDP77635.1 uncharacterized protein YebE (UPF0316 family) [Bradymonas sediminis]
MNEFLYTTFGITPEIFSYVVLPLFIFLARVCDVTLSTIKILFVMNGERRIAPILGFFEAFIWLLAIGQIITDVNNPLSYFAYASGFATGTFAGMYIEEKLAVGKVVLRLIIREINDELLHFLHENNFRYSLIDGMGRRGRVNVVFLVVRRQDLDRLIAGVNEHQPNAFYTIEGVRKVNAIDQFSVSSSRRESTPRA